MFNVYFSIDEALGYQDVRDDLAEVYAVGCRRVVHYFRAEDSRDERGGRFWAGLDRWLEANPDKAMKLSAWKQEYGDALGWKLFFYTTYLQEAYDQTAGGLKVLVGEMYGLFPSERHDEALKRFVSAIRKYESQHCAGTIGGWYVAEEPNSPRKSYQPERYQAIINTIRSVEAERDFSSLPMYVDTSPYGDLSKVVPFLVGADVIMISPDAYIWARVPPMYVEEAQFESIPHAVRSMRDHAKAAGNSNAKIEIVLQAYDWNKASPLQPNHINMHQQVRYARQAGWVDRGEYGKQPRWEPPPEGIWFWWWHDCKSTKRLPKGEVVEINRWDGNWAEAIQTEFSHEEKGVLIRGAERWEGAVHIIGDVIVAEGATLTIAPGTTVKFATRDHFRGGEDPMRCELIVRGKLVALGTEGKKISLTSDAQNPKLSPEPRKPKAKDWFGVRREGKAATVEMANCEIQYALDSRAR